jgi:type IV pilus assembly protein PilV
MLIKQFLFSKRNETAGFTLVEILIAMTIFAVAVLGLAVGTVNVVRTNQTGHLSTSAINLAQTKIEELRAMSATAFAGLTCPLYTSTGCSDTASASGKSFSRSWQITANSPVAGVNKIDVKIDWTDYSNRSLTVSASVAQ